MREFSKEDMEEAQQVLSSTIKECEKMQLKFSEGTPQHTLLKNRIKALNISRTLMSGETMDQYANEELEEALQPVSSMIGKCEKAKLKFAEGSSHHTRLKKILKAMQISRVLIIDEMNKRR